MINGINTVLLNPDTSPSWIDLLGDEYSSAETLEEEFGPLLNFAPKILPPDELLVLGADVIDGTCGLDPSFMRLDLMDNALSVGAGVSVFCSFRSNVNPAIIERIKMMPKASFYLRDELSLHSFKSQTGMVAEFFPDFFSFCGVNNSARVKAYRQELTRKKRSGQTLVGLNFSEHAFRSLYDEHNQANRERYVESVVSSLLAAAPNAFFALFSNDSRRWDNFPPDSEYQNLARSSLLTRTAQDCFVLVDPDLTYPETISLLSSVDILVTGRMHLCLAASRSGTVPIVLMGHGKGYSSIEKMKGGFAKYIGTTTLVVPETKELESTIRHALSQLEDLKRTIKRRNKTNAAQASVDLERLRSRLRINQISPMHEMIKSRFASMLKNVAAAFGHSHTPAPPQSLVASKSQKALYALILTFIEKSYQDFRQETQTNPNSDLSGVRVDGESSWIPEMLARSEPHDQDYRVFHIFQNSQSLILDVGANWGYSVGSLWSTGCKSHVVSFEAIPLYKECLDAIKKIHPDRYDYFITGLADQPMICNFVVPVVNGLALTALTSASKTPHLPSLAKNIVDYVNQWMPDVDRVEFSLCSFTVPVVPLDAVIARNPQIFANKVVVAIKIDVEGLEFEVLKGARDLLESQTPMIMAEGGNRRTNLSEFMVSLGYLFAERDGDKLVLLDAAGTASNGFFLHKSKIPYYLAIGIL